MNRPADGITTATVKPKLRSREGGAAVPRRADKRLMNLLQSSYPLEPEPFDLIASEAELHPDEVKSRLSGSSTSGSSARSPRSSTPAPLATARCWSPPRSTPRTRTAAQIINSHPGVSHNYLRTHEFNLWFTIATSPDSQSGWRGRSTSSRS